MQQPSRGFTLVEMILYIFIVGVILSVLALFLLQLLNARTKTYAISEVLSSAHLIEERLSEAIRHASSIEIADSQFQSDPGVLSLNMVDAGRTPVTFSLTQDNGQFQVSEGGNNPVVLSPDNIEITNLVFTNLTTQDDTGMIRVEFTVKISSDSATKAFTYEQSFQTALRIPLD